MKADADGASAAVSPVLAASAARRRWAFDWDFEGRAGFGVGSGGGAWIGSTTGASASAGALVTEGVSPGRENETAGSGGKAPLPGSSVTGPQDRHTGVSDGSSFAQRLQIKRPE